MFVTDVASTSGTVVQFNESTYSVNESNWLIQPVLILCTPLSTDITIQVTSVDVTASGEQL